MTLHTWSPLSQPPAPPAEARVSLTQTFPRPLLTEMVTEQDVSSTSSDF